jgi:hypothetical protein
MACQGIPLCIINRFFVFEVLSKILLDVTNLLCRLQHLHHRRLLRRESLNGRLHLGEIARSLKVPIMKIPMS